MCRPKAHGFPTNSARGDVQFGTRRFGFESVFWGQRQAEDRGAFWFHRQAENFTDTSECGDQTSIIQLSRSLLSWCGALHKFPGEGQDCHRLSSRKIFIGEGVRTLEASCSSQFQSCCPSARPDDHGHYRLEQRTLLQMLQNIALPIVPSVVTPVCVSVAAASRGTRRASVLMQCDGHGHEEGCQSGF